MIGLEGGWGSGKTTVINMVSDLLEGKSNITVFRFDAWAHQGDPLRRTYLESLIVHFQNLRGTNWLPEKRREHWKDRVLEISRRKRVTETRTDVLPSTFAQWAAAATLLMPIGLVLLNRGLETGVTFNRSNSVNWNFVIGVLLSPALLWLGLYHGARALWRNEKPNFRLFEEKQNETERSETIETPEPTSLEFERFFDELMDDVLSKNHDRSVVVVLDNLDRVDAADFLAVWATLQTFLQHRGIDEKSWRYQIRFVVPFDLEGLQSLWENRGAGNSENIESSGVAASFLDKSFQIRFEVPPLLLSDWKFHLIDLLHQALPNHDDADLQAVFQVLSRCLGSKPPTPRELILFVNQIGAVHRQWQDGHSPLDHIAYYAYLRRHYSQKEVQRDLLDAKHPPADLQSLFTSSDALRRSLAGLFFNVPPDHGMQLLIGGAIREAIAKDPLELQRLEQLHGRDFWDVIEIVSYDLIGRGAGELANAGMCLDKSKLLDQDRDQAKVVRRRIGQAAQKVAAWAPIEISLLEGVCSICRIVDDSVVTAAVIARLRDSVQTEPILPSELSTSVVDGLVTIFDTVSSLGHQAALTEPFVIRVDENSWIALCQHLAVEPLLRWNALIRPIGGFQHVAEGLAVIASGGSWTIEHLTALNVTQRAFGGGDWTPLTSAIDQRLSQVAGPSRPSTLEVTLLLGALSAVRRYAPELVLVVLKHQADSGYLSHWLNQAQAEDNTPCKAACIAAFWEQKPDLAAPQGIANSIAGHQVLLSLLTQQDAALAEQIVTDLTSVDKLDVLFTIADSRNVLDPLVVACLNVAAESDKPERIFTPASLLAHWKGLYKQMTAFQNLIGTLSRKAHFISDLQRAEGGFNKSNVGLYLAICTTDATAAFREWCRQGLHGLSKEDWISEITTYGDALRLAIVLVQKGDRPALTQYFQDALRERAKEVATGTVTLPTQFIADRKTVFAVLDPSQLPILRSRLVSVAIESNGKASDQFFAAFGEEIAHPEAIRRHQTVIEGLFSPLVETQNVAGLRWLKGVIQINQGLLNESEFDKDAVLDFRNRIQTESRKSEEQESEAHRVIVEIGGELGIPTEPTQPDHEAPPEPDK